jgi:hypothetical protein
MAEEASQEQVGPRAEAGGPGAAPGQKGKAAAARPKSASGGGSDGAVASGGSAGKRQKTSQAAVQPGPAAASATARSPAAAGPAVVSLSGLHTDERQHLAAALHKLPGARCLAFEHTFEPGTTHVVMPELKRSDKTLSAMAAGERWARGTAHGRRGGGRAPKCEHYEAAGQAWGWPPQA